jgi:hypothetical protein
MKRAAVAVGVFATLLVLLVFVFGRGVRKHDVRPAAAAAPAIAPGPETYQGFLYGRITTVDGATYEGRLRWGVGEEAFWGDTFNGSKHENPWLAEVPPDRRLREHHPIEIFGIKLAERERQLDVRRQLMARFGEIARLEATGVKLVRVTLKSGTVVDLDRFEASDFDDTVRVWDGTRGVVDLDSLRIRTIELLPTPLLQAAPSRLHGTVHTHTGDYTGFVAWDRDKSVGTDELAGRAAEGELRLRFDTIRSIARRSRDSLVTLLDGREIALFGSRDAGRGNRGVYVDDPRYGRVLISWDAFERVDFSPSGSGPAYGDFPPGRPLTGSVTTRAGSRLAGRIVYDLDESETGDTLDAPSEGVDYNIPLGQVASIVPPGPQARGDQRAKVTLQSGEELQLDCRGDLGPGNAGLLIFVDGRQHPEYVSWTDVGQIDFDRPPTM